MADAPETAKSDDLLSILEREVKDILTGEKKPTKADRMSAINAGTRLLAVRHKINGSEQEEGFFK